MQLIKTARMLLEIQEYLSSKLIDDFDIYMFDQTWPSTTLGFGGIGGSAITTETTFVLMPKMYGEQLECAYVFFGGNFAYKVQKINECFREDLKNHNIASVKESIRYSY